MWHDPCFQSIRNDWWVGAQAGSVRAVLETRPSALELKEQVG